MKTYIWSLPTRVFHFLLVVFILIAWLSADDDFLQIHSAVGYAIAVLLIFRLLWGIIGPQYSKFKDFNFKMSEALTFARSIFTFNGSKKYLGHNPAASILMFMMIIILSLIVLTGILDLGIQEGKGFFAFLHQTSIGKLELFEELHEIFANILLLFIVMHLAGILTDKLLHSEDKTLQSMMTGYKHIKGQDIKLNLFQILISFVFFILTFLIIYFTFTNLPFLYD